MTGTPDLLHVGDVGERLRGADRPEAGEARRARRQEGAVDLVAVQVDQVARRVVHLIGVTVDDAVAARGRRPLQLRLQVPVPEEPLEPAVAARLVGQRVRHRSARRARVAELRRRGARAERVALGAVDAEADVVRDLLILVRVRIGSQLLHLGRAGAEHVLEVGIDVLELQVGGRDGAEVAARARERHPRRRRRARRPACGHGRGVGLVRERIRPVRAGPVGERALRQHAPIGLVGLVRIRQPLAVAVAVQAAVVRDRVVGGVPDQRRVVVREHRAVRCDEAGERRHLLEVGEDVRVVSVEVHVVEGDLDHVLDAVRELTVCGRRRDRGRARARDGSRSHRCGHARECKADRDRQAFPELHTTPPSWFRWRAEPTTAALGEGSPQTVDSVTGLLLAQRETKPMTSYMRASVGAEVSRAFSAPIPSRRRSSLSSGRSSAYRSRTGRNSSTTASPTSPLRSP